MQTRLLSTISPRFLAALAGCLSAALALAGEATTNHVFQVAPGGKLVLDADRGSITLSTAETNAVGVTIVREVKRLDEKQAQEVLDAHQIAFAQEGNTVTVRARFPKDASWGRRNPNLNVRYEVTVPKQFDLNLSTAGGAISVSDIAGQVHLNTAGGSISIGQVDGTVKADTAGGGITVAGATSALDANTAGGNIHLGVMGGAVKADTSGGSIHLKSAAGPIHAETAGGSIELGDVSGPVHAETSGGSISARFVKSPGGDSVLETSGGSVTVYLLDGLPFDVDAECSGGRVTADLPIASQGKTSRTEVKGQIGKGGPKLKLRSSGGGVHLKPLLAEAK